MKILDRDVAIHNLRQEILYTDTPEEVEVGLSLITLLEQDKIEAFKEFGVETRYRFKKR